MSVLSESKKLQLLLQNPAISSKLRKLEDLCIEAWKLTGNTDWLLLDIYKLRVSCSGRIEYLTLYRQTRKWLFTRLEKVICYQCYSSRYMFNFVDSIIFNLDEIMDALQEIINEARDEHILDRDYYDALMEV